MDRSGQGIKHRWLPEHIEFLLHMNHRSWAWEYIEDYLNAISATKQYPETMMGWCAAYYMQELVKEGDEVGQHIFLETARNYREKISKVMFPCDPNHEKHSTVWVFAQTLETFIEEGIIDRETWASLTLHYFDRRIEKEYADAPV